MKTWLARFLPHSKKARLLLAFFVLLLAGILAIFFMKGEKKDPQLNSKFVQNKEQIDKLRMDSDNDGLRDWEETIYHTDPKNPDTDNDKTPDGEEIKLGRDPLKPGPDDNPQKNTENPKPYSELTLTERIASQLNNYFILPRLTNQEIQFDVPSISEQIAEETFASVQTAYEPTYKLSDLQIIRKIDANAIETYSVSFDAIFTDAFAGITKPEIVVFSEAIQNETLADLVILDRYLRAYESSIENLKKLSVPEPLAQYQLDYLNTLVIHREAVAKIRKGDKDILVAVVGAQEYVQTAKKLNAVIDNLNKEAEKYL